jgi:N-acetylneuraminate synthase
MSKVFIIAEVGINHNGDINIVKKLIDGAVECGVDAVKFQKRTIDIVYTKEELDKPRESPWGTTNRQQKEGLELNEKQYDEINSYCISKKIEWFASSWDGNSQTFLSKYDLKYNKIASAMLTNRELVTQVAKEGKYTFISTGMSTIEQIEKAIEIFIENRCPYELMHCNSIYPMPKEEANLKTIPYLRDRFCCKVGYSGHEAGIIISCAAVAIGATSIERHITLDRSMYGSDQSASLEINGLRKMIQYIRDIEIAMGSMGKFVGDREKEIAKKLRKVNTL